jgi:hypothetical protein
MRAKLVLCTAQDNAQVAHKRLKLHAEKQPKVIIDSQKTVEYSRRNTAT